jgi:GntR family transcriptional regulator
VADGHRDLIDPIAPVPPYRQIAEIIRRRIGAGEYRPDTRIPTESEIVGEFEVARSTARRAVADFYATPPPPRRAVAVLRDEGLVYTVPNRGSYVARPSSG